MWLPGRVQVAKSGNRFPLPACLLSSTAHQLSKRLGPQPSPKNFQKKQGNFQVVSPCWRFARSWGSLEVCVCFELLADWWLVCWAEEAGGWCATHQASRWPAATARTRLCWGNNAKYVAGFNVVEIVKVEFNANLGLLLSWWPPKLSLATYV